MGQAVTDTRTDGLEFACQLDFSDILEVDPISRLDLTSLAGEISIGGLALNIAGTFHQGVTEIEALIVSVMAMNLQQGISNSLDAKLEAALNTLDDVNDNNDVSALNMLDALIQSAEAQRGGKLTDSQANTIIGSAQSIIDLLLSP